MRIKHLFIGLLLALATANVSAADLFNNLSIEAGNAQLTSKDVTLNTTYGPVDAAPSDSTYLSARYMLGNGGHGNSGLKFGIGPAFGTVTNTAGLGITAQGDVDTLTAQIDANQAQIDALTAADPVANEVDIADLEELVATDKVARQDIYRQHTEGDQKVALHATVGYQVNIGQKASLTPAVEVFSTDGDTVPGLRLDYAARQSADTDLYVGIRAQKDFVGAQIGAAF